MSVITPLHKFFSDPIIDNFVQGQVHHHIMLKAYATGCTFRFLYNYQGKEIHEIRLVTERAKCCFSLHAFYPRPWRSLKPKI